ncbi:hypothetical protein BPOR_0049g00090 [Botrytis porri]|uniref:Uncharacterized protein n=1 Tax=Botrytis porri TaxID=87229 RepID=A0A4Z1L1Y2_9HELO|nr:hypothetical protein BPOR_0049g00090 [Botrytis porri]
MIETIGGYLGRDPPEDPNAIEHSAEEWKLVKKITELLEPPEAQQQSGDFKAKLIILMRKLIGILPATPEIDCDREMLVMRERSSAFVKDGDQDIEDLDDKSHSENSSKGAGFENNPTLGYSRRTEFQNHTQQRRIVGRASEKRPDWDDALMEEE